MIKFFKAADGSIDIHMDAPDAGRINHAITTARPSGSVEVVIGSQVVRVHVHAEPAEPRPTHEPIGAR